MSFTEDHQSVEVSSYFDCTLTVPALDVDGHESYTASLMFIAPSLEVISRLCRCVLGCERRRRDFNVSTRVLGF